MTTPEYAPDVTKIGNLTKDPIPGEGDKTNYARFSLAVTPYVPGKALTDPEPPTIYYEVTCFGALATHVCETLLKGDRVSVTGSPETDVWNGRDGQPRTTKRIIVGRSGSVAADLLFSSVAIIRTNKADGRSEPRHAPLPVAASTETLADF